MFTTTRFLAVAAALATGAQQVWAQEATASTLEIEGVTANFEREFRRYRSFVLFVFPHPYG